MGLTLNARELPSALIDRPVPKFELAAVRGRTQGFASADLRGEVSVVNVFASSCKECRDQHPLWLRGEPACQRRGHRVRPFMLGLWRWLPFLQRDLRLHPDMRGRRPLAAFVLDAAFAFGWTPCIGPVLGAVLRDQCRGHERRSAVAVAAFQVPVLLQHLAAIVQIDGLGTGPDGIRP